MKVNKLAEKFLQHSSRTNAPKSLEGMRDRLRLFLEAFGDQNTKRVSREALIAFLQSSQGTLSDTTHRANITAVERLQSWSVRFEYLKKPWTRRGDVRKPPQVNRDTLPTLEQSAQILSIMRPDAQLIYRCQILTGARPGELCGAMVDQLHGTPGEMLIILEKHKTVKKTGKPRRILLSEQAEAVVRESIGDRTDGPIFLTRLRKPWVVDRLSREFRRCRNKLGLSKRIVLYSTRHQAASLMIEAGADISVVQAQLGHTDIATTQKYLHINDRKVRESVAKISDVKLAEAG